MYACTHYFVHIWYQNPHLRAPGIYVDSNNSHMLPPPLSAVNQSKPQRKWMHRPLCSRCMDTHHPSCWYLGSQRSCNSLVINIVFNWLLGKYDRHPSSPPAAARAGCWSWVWSCLLPLEITVCNDWLTYWLPQEALESSLAKGQPEASV